MKAFTLLLVLASSAAAQTTLPADAATQLAAEFAPRLAASRYLEADDGREAKVSGWENFPTRRYTYTVKDRDGTAKSAEVILLDPSADQIAGWIVNAIIEVKGKYTPEAGQKLFRHIINQSGGQFPVAGVVYEDILPHDGKNESYCFRDGVTVEVEGVPHRGVEPLTPEQSAASINGKVKRVFTYGRIASTSPKMWIDAGGPREILGPDGKPTQRWLDEVRKAYQAAWGSPRNELLVAWVRAGVK